MSSVSTFNPNDPYEMLIAQIIRMERQPQDRLKAERDTHNRLKRVMSDVNSMISSLHKLTKEFTAASSSPFSGRSASVSNETAFSVSASSSAALGSHTLDVQRLASADTRISKQFSTAGTDLRTFFDANGAQSFNIRIAKPTSDDPNNIVDVAVSVDPTGSTDDEILSEIRTAINNAMDQAVTDGTLAAADKAVGSVVQETSSTARLSLRSGKTGFDNRLQFTDSASGLLALLEVTNESEASGTGGGAVVAVGTSETDSALNSRFVLDGLTLYRSTNTVSDALDGVTLNFKKAGEGAVEFSVKTDTEGIKGKVNDFIKKYNELQTFLSNKSMVDGTTGSRGDLAGDTTFSTLRLDMRNDMARSVSGQPADAPTLLADIGIKINRDGTLELSDADKLIKAVEKDAAAVESLFDADTGYATRLQERLERFVGIDGVISNRKKSSDDRIRRLDNRIKDWDDRLKQREDQLRMQFAKLQESVAVMRGQQQYLGTFLYGGYGF